jgi:Flp pilus assembly protein TadG
MKPASAIAGTTAVEFAIAIGVVLALVFAVIDLGRLFLAQHALNYGVVAAARYAVVNGTVATTTTIQNKFTAAITPALGATQAAAASVHVSFSPSEKVGATVTVSATLAWTPATAVGDFVALTLSSSQTLTIVH